MTIPTNLLGLSPAEMKTALLDAGVESKSVSMRVKQLWNWIYVHGARDFAQMTNLAKDFRALLEGKFTLARPQIVTEQISNDGTRKWLLRSGGQEFETVYIPESDRGTLCVSSQVGCTLNCRFCHTGTQKMVRNLTPDEILGQLFVARDSLGDWPSTAPGRKVTNIVMMGMGEPLYNFDNVKAALAIVMDGDGLALSKRRVTLSTAGVVPMIQRAGDEIGSSLAISLHAVRDEVRDVIVPINKKYKIAELLDACRAYPGASNARRITFEYVMLKGVNDSLTDAKALVKLLKGIPAKINLIPFNPWPGAPYECSDWEQIEKFAEVVNRAGYASPVRTPRGRDIMAACGQLKSESVKLKAKDRIAEMEASRLAQMPG
ncbi:MAG: 23S rRNA (adenine(2503)-C(2))-methyltransferase RlmN [Proteobacteria bacterium]|nr:23S rRNA (adenine(2503)-C(2))-methyltransferase RlmN [Pseudomonadota bacterium]